MGSKANAWETGLLLLLFNNTDFANVGNAGGLRGSTVAGSLYVSLHTGDPGEAGSQTTNETSYSSYARASAVRSAAGWTVSGGSVQNAANILFVASTGSNQAITHWGLGTDPSGAGTLLYFGALTTGFTTVTGIPPVIVPGSAVITED